jgi:hypothetical protein
MVASRASATEYPKPEALEGRGIENTINGGFECLSHRTSDACYSPDTSGRLSKAEELNM